MDWNSRKELVRDMYRISKGMTTDEVNRIMSCYRIEKGDDFEHQRLPPDSDLIYMVPRSADAVIVGTREGRVVSVVFSAD